MISTFHTSYKIIFFFIIQRAISSQTSCGCIPSEIHENFIEMMNFSLFKDPIFILFTLSNFATSLGFNVPYVYLADQAKVLNLSTEQGSYLLAIIGIANTFGRIILGYLSDKSWVNRLWVYNVCLTICGLGKLLVRLLNIIKIKFIIFQLRLVQLYAWIFLRWLCMREYMALQ